MANTLEKRDIRIFLSTKTVETITSLGGSRTIEELSDNRLHNFFQKTTDEEQRSGIIKFRCGYVYNANASVAMKNPALFIVSDTTSPNDSVEIGWGTAAVGTGYDDDPDSIEQALDNENQFPSGVVFRDGNIRSNGSILGADIIPLRAKPFWVKYESLFNAQDFPFNKFVVRCVCDNLISTIPKPTGPPPPSMITFAILGEGSSDEDFTKIMSYIYPQNFDFLVTTGNNNVNANPQFFLDAMGNLIGRTLLCFGWYDVQSAEVINAYVNALAATPFVSTPAQRYYSKTIGNIHFIVMDTYGQSYLQGSEQYNFVENDLKDAYTDSNIDWIFVVTNKNIYGSQTTSATRFQYEDFRNAFHDMFTKYGVLCVFQGTFNFYERSKVLKFNPLNTNQPGTFAYDGPDNYLLYGKKSFIDGQIWITLGTGGALHDVITTPATYLDFSNWADFGYMKVICDNTLTNKKITFRFYATSGTTQVFKDQFTITRMIT